MLRRWLLYLAVLAGSIGFFIAHGQWFSWLILVTVLVLPLIGVLVSLPAFTGPKPEFSCPARCRMGDTVTVGMEMKDATILSETRWRVLVKTSRAGKSRLLKAKAPLPTEHCGQLLCLPDRVRLYDCLGLFARSYRKQPVLRLSVLPHPIPIQNLPELEQYLSSSWQPKPGGGFAENYELRLYRPGDSLNQIHWKLTAKTGKYIIREAMVPRKQQVALIMKLTGTAEELDRAFGRLLWLGLHLLEKGLPFRIYALTGSETLCLAVDSEEALYEAMDQLLGAECAEEGAELDSVNAPWRYAIGGEPDEA